MELSHWPWGPDANAQRKLKPHQDCLARLLAYDLTRVAIIEAYYRCHVAPLMARPLRLFEMGSVVLEAQLLPCLVSRVFPSKEEIRARFEELLSKAKADALEILTPGQPFMLPGLGR